MTAGSGILHDEVPTEAFVRIGGRSHGVQLWVNLPAALKFTPPRYQAITARRADAAHVRRRRRAGAAHRRRPRRPRRSRRRRTRRSPTPTRASAPGAQLERAVEPDVQRAGLRALAAAATPATSGARSTSTSSWCSAPATPSRSVPPPTQPEDSPNLEVLLLGGLPDPRADRPLRPVPDEHPRGDPAGDRRLPGRAHGRHPRDRRSPGNHGLRRSQATRQNSLPSGSSITWNGPWSSSIGGPCTRAPSAVTRSVSARDVVDLDVQVHAVLDRSSPPGRAGTRCGCG